MRRSTPRHAIPLPQVRPARPARTVAPDPPARSVQRWLTRTPIAGRLARCRRSRTRPRPRPSPRPRPERMRPTMRRTIPTGDPSHTQVAIPLFPRFTALDGIGPYEVLQRVPDIDVTFVGHERGCGPQRQRDARHPDRRPLRGRPATDVVVVPGGVGTRALTTDRRVLDWVRAAHRTTAFTTSVCTGSLVLAAAGLLDGLRATTHWSMLADARRVRGGAERRPRRGTPRAPDHHRRRGARAASTWRCGWSSCCATAPPPRRRS